MTKPEMLFDLEKQQFEHEWLLKDHQRSLLYHPESNSDLDDESECDQSRLPVKAKYSIEHQQAERNRLKTWGDELAEEVFRSPLRLIKIPESHRPFFSYLRSAKYRLENGGGSNEALWECQRAAELLTTDKEFQLSDRGLVWLFQAGISWKQGKYEEAQNWAKRAYQFSPNGYNPYRMVARLIQGNSCTANGNGRILEGENAYGALCAYNSETTLPKKLESNIMRAEEKW